MLPTPTLTEAATGTIQLAKADPVQSPAVVLDYSALSTTSNKTLQGDTTYYVSGAVNLSGTTIIEGGTVVKFAKALNSYKITILAPEEIDFKEREIQNAFERDLAKLEDGLVLVKSELVIGTGRIDTLAFDTNTSCPVFVEYKRRGEFGKDALIQLMEYLSWFAKDKNRMAILEKLIRKQIPDVDEVEPSIRLICVVSHIDDQIRNAIYAIRNDIKVYSYIVAHDTAGKLVMVRKLEVDNGEIERLIPEVKTEEEILKKHSNLQELFALLRGELGKDGTQEYTTANSFRFKKNTVFAKLHFRKKYIQLELKVGQRKVTDKEFKYWREGESEWGWAKIYPGKTIPEKVVKWIEIARNFSSQSAGEDEETVEEGEEDKKG